MLHVNGLQIRQSIAMVFMLARVMFCLETTSDSNMTRTVYSRTSTTTRTQNLNCSKFGEVKTVNVSYNISLKSENSTEEKDGERKLDNNLVILTSGEIHRQRIIVSGYLIFAVVFVGLVFLVVTHFLGRREVRKYQRRYGLTYFPAPSKAIRRV